MANKAGETAAYPGAWLYAQWSDSDLKAWCDERGIPVPQTGNRDSLIATIRRHSYVAAQEANKRYNSATKQAASAQQSLSNQLLDSWSDSQVKEWLDKNGIPVPQGSKRNELTLPVFLATTFRTRLPALTALPPLLLATTTLRLLTTHTLVSATTTTTP